MNNETWDVCVTRANATYAREARWLPSVEEQLDGVAGQRFVATDGTLGALLYQQHLNAEEDLSATWSPIDAWKAVPIVSGRPSRGAISELLLALNRYREIVNGRSLENPAVDRALSISWPSFVRVSQPMRDVGFRPVTTLASLSVIDALKSQRTPDGVARYEVRMMTEADIHFVERAWLGLICEEASYGSAIVRQSASALIRARVMDWRRRSDAMMLVAFSDDAFVGFSAAHILKSGDALRRKIADDCAWYADAAFVFPAYRGAGVGRALALSMGKRVLESGYRNVILHYSNGNPASGQFWRSLGAKACWETWWRQGV